MAVKTVGQKGWKSFFDQSKLNDYVGKYYSDELEKFYEIVLQDSQLVTTHQRQEDISITIASRDISTENAWWFQHV